jgi:hypothetical protein
LPALKPVFDALVAEGFRIACTVRKLDLPHAARWYS